MLVCSPQMGLAPDSMLGGEVYDYNTLTRMAELGNQVRVILPAPKEVPGESGIVSTTIESSKGRYANFAFVGAVRRMYKERPFDLLRIHSPRYVGPAGLLFRLEHPRVPIVAHHHHMDAGRLNEFLLRLVLTYSDAVITVSEFSRRQMARRFGEREQVHVVYNGVDEVYAPCDNGLHLRRRAGLGSSKIVLSVGSLIPRKDPLFLLRAFRGVLQRVPDARLVFIGDGELRFPLENLARRLRLDRAVIFAGQVTQEEKLGWLNACDVFVSASRLEGFGLAAAESMACGKAVVAMDVASLPEVVEDGITGYLVPPGNSSSFIEATAAVLSNRQIRARMGKAGVARVNRLFRWDKTVDETLRIYEDAVARRARVFHEQDAPDVVAGSRMG